jgi:hypothetical protein
VAAAGFEGLAKDVFLLGRGGGGHGVIVEQGPVLSCRFGTDCAASLENDPRATSH